MNTIFLLESYDCIHMYINACTIKKTVDHQGRLLQLSVAESITNASHLIFVGLVQRTSKWVTGLSFTRAGDAMPVGRRL